METNNVPMARHHDILVQEMQDEVLVYDLKSNKAFCLNETSAAVWQLCNGKTTAEIGKELGLPEEAVIFAIRGLQLNNLIERGSLRSSLINQVSRRTLITQFGKTAFAIPLISTVIAPLSINAQSGCSGPTTQSCTVGVGACQRTGTQTRTCVAGVFTAWSACSVSPGIPSAEIPGDGIDNNCNGQTDEP